MNTHKQNSDFLHIGYILIKWYEENARNLPFRNTKNPYLIWVCEVVFQQTRISQGLEHYNKFIERFPTIESLAEATTDEVLLYWKGLGYYSRAINLLKAAQEICSKHNGVFPNNFNDILELKGVGKYIASAISSICFGENTPAIDGNFYRVFSRLLADDFDVSDSKSFDYFAKLALDFIPEGKTGDFNQAIMDLGATICKPKIPNCKICPIQDYCLAYQTNKIHLFPNKSKKTTVIDLELVYYFTIYKNQFLIKRRNTNSIWKNLYEFPTQVSEKLIDFRVSTTKIKHKLTHRNLFISIETIQLNDEFLLNEFASKEGFLILSFDEAFKKSFPKPLENFLLDYQENILYF